MSELGVPALHRAADDARKSSRQVVLLLSFAVASALLFPLRVAYTQMTATITLSPSASPSAGQPAVTVINLTGSGFPSGTILPADVTVSLKPSSSGSGPSGTVTAGAVTTISGSTRRVTFQIPNSIMVSVPVAYRVSVSGTTSGGTTFASGNTAALTINPPASISSVNPNSGKAGQTLSVAITTLYTNFVQGSTQASFGSGISVGGAAQGAFGPLTVTSATTATAQITIDPNAAAGSRTVTVETGIQRAALANGFSITSQQNQPPVVTAGSPQVTTQNARTLRCW